MSAASDPLNILFTWTPPEDGLAIVQDAVPGLCIEVAADRKQMLARIGEADIACVGDFDAEMLASAKQLRWIQALMGGVESVLFPALRDSPILLTCCKECFAVPGAEYALAVMLAFSRRLEYDLRRRPLRTFEYRDPEELHGKTAGILGLGHIGREIARRCKCFGMQVFGSARRPRERDAEIDRFFPLAHLPDMLSASDFVIVATPLTPETQGLIGSAELARMQPTAYLIDVSGRPALYDLTALEQALRAGRIAGASLQMVPSEGSPFWELENVLLSFHRATSPQEVTRCFELFAANLRRFRAHEPLLGLVDKAAGY